jgi:hypothetical protein
MPRIVHGIVHPKERVSFRPCTPERAVLMHIWYHNQLSIRQIRIRGAKILVGYGCPAHTALASAIDNAGVDLAEGLLYVVVEASRNADACGPELDVRELVHRVISEAHVEAYEIVEL